MQTLYYNFTVKNQSSTDLRKKTEMILLILSARRKFFFSIHVDIVVQHDKCIFLPYRTLKETRPDYNIQPIVYNAFNENNIVVGGIILLETMFRGYK